MRHWLLIIVAAVLAAVVLTAQGPAGTGDAPSAEPPGPAQGMADELKARPAVAEALQGEVAVDGKSGEAEAPPANNGEPAEKASAEKALAEEAPGEGPGEGPRELKLEDIRDLPILKRYDLPLEKGEQLLADVKDETFGYDESAFWWIVSLVANMPAEAFEPKEVTAGFTQLLAMPSSYRGTPVTLRGMYMTASPFETPVLAVRKDIPTLYECNIRELPIEEERPVATVICIEDPMEHLRVGDVVKVRGYFYKTRAYQGSKGPGLAPMLITQRLVPEGRSLPGAGGQGRESEWAYVGMMVAAVLVLGGLYVYLRFKTKATPHAARESTGHRIRLRRPGGDQPPADTRPGGEGGRPQP